MVANMLGPDYSEWSADGIEFGRVVEHIEASLERRRRLRGRPSLRKSVASVGVDLQVI